MVLMFCWVDAGDVSFILSIILFWLKDEKKKKKPPVRTTETTRTLIRQNHAQYGKDIFKALLKSCGAFGIYSSQDPQSALQTNVYSTLNNILYRPSSEIYHHMVQVLHSLPDQPLIPLPVFGERSDDPLDSVEPVWFSGPKGTCGLLRVGIAVSEMVTR